MLIARGEWPGFIAEGEAPLQGKEGDRHPSHQGSACDELDFGSSLSLSEPQFPPLNGVDPALLWDGPPAWGLVGRHPFLCLPPGVEDRAADSHTRFLGEGFEYES